MESAEKQVLGRAFDKAVRRKPLALAADAVGLCQLNVVKEGRRRRAVVSESTGRALGGCCRVVVWIMTRVKLGMFR